jgi:hypothetical protein
MVGILVAGGSSGGRLNPVVTLGLTAAKAFLPRSSSGVSTVMPYFWLSSLAAQGPFTYKLSGSSGSLYAISRSSTPFRTPRPITRLFTSSCNHYKSHAPRPHTAALDSIPRLSTPSRGPSSSKKTSPSSSSAQTRPSWTSLARGRVVIENERKFIPSVIYSLPGIKMLSSTL